MEIPPSADKLAELVIISYLVCLVIEGRAEQICFLLAQCVVESCLIPKSFRDVTRLPANIQKK